MTDRGRVLLVSGDLAGRAAMTEALRLQGLSFRACDSLDDALACVRTEVFDVALVSLRLPDDEDGMALGTCLRVLDPTLGLVLMTDGADERVAANALRCGFDDYLIHPVGERELVAAVLDVLQSALARRKDKSTAAEEEAIESAPPSPAVLDQRIEGAAALASDLSVQLRALAHAAHAQATELARSDSVVKADAAHAFVQWAMRMSVLQAHLEVIAGSKIASDQAVNIRVCVREVLALFADVCAGARVHVTSDIPEDLPRARGDERGFRQVLMELVHNAIHATEGAAKREVFITAKADSRAVEVKVTDTGIGIVNKDLERIFWPFFTCRRARFGAGLGLYCCRRIVQGMRGDLSVTSRPSEGSCFVVRIPVYGLDAVP